MSKQRSASEILKDFQASNNIQERSRLADELIALSQQQRARKKSKIADLQARLQRAENVISQFVHERAPMTPEQRAAWTAWKEGEG